jgi:peptide subunit release factor 1 (eRF1)
MKPAYYADNAGRGWHGRIYRVIRYYPPPATRRNAVVIADNLSHDQAAQLLKKKNAPSPSIR